MSLPSPEKFAALVERFSARTTEVNMAEMLGWMKAREPFCHLRINDGESLCLLGLRRPTERNNCGHLYMPTLAAALRRTVTEIIGAVRSARNNGQPQPNVRVGGYWYTQGSTFTEENPDEAARGLIDWLGESIGEIPWVGSDDIVRGVLTGQTFEMFDEIRRRAQNGTPVYLVGNSRIEPGRHCLGAEFVEIPRIDCWAVAPLIMSNRGLLIEAADAIIVWCCGMSKSWLWDLWRLHPGSTHVDAGHLFDAAMGEFNRAYTRRRDRSEPMWAAYEDKFIPYVRGFIK